MAEGAVLVDSSAWIEFFRDARSAAGALVDRLLEDEIAATVDVVRAEILQGCRTEAEFARLGTLMDALIRLPAPEDVWDRVARLGYHLRREGVNGVGIPDLLVAVTAAAHDAPILTLDRHFRAIAAVLPLALVRVDGPPSPG